MIFMIVPNVDLFACLSTGDEKGFGKLVDTFQDQVYLYAKSIVGNAEAAREISNDCFIKLWEQRQQTSTISSLKGYLFRMVHNSAIDYLRSLKKSKNTIVSVEEIQQRIEIFEIADSSSSIENLFSDQFENAFLQEMAKLPEQCREIFILCRYHQLSYSEISTKLNVSLSTVKTQMVRAMNKLKEGLKDYF